MKGFALNQATTKYWPLEDLVRGCVASGVAAVGLWREDVQAYGLDRSARLMRDAGLVVSSLCRGGFFGADGWLDDNRCALDEAATLGTDTLVLVSGGLGRFGRDVDGAREHVGAAIGELVPHALSAGVRLAIEPLHPMFASDRCVVSTLGQALALAAPYPAAAVGVCVDTYHLWWDDTVWDQLARHGDRIAAFQLADWITPLPAGVLTGRGLPGTGCIDMDRFTRAVTAAGYSGWTEVEVFNEEVWSQPGDVVLASILSWLKNSLPAVLQPR